MTTPQLDDVKQRLLGNISWAKRGLEGQREHGERKSYAGYFDEYLPLAESLLEAVEAIEQRDRMLDEARSAFRKIMEVSGTSTLHYHTASAALAKLEEMKR